MTTDLSKGLRYIMLSITGFLNFVSHIAFRTEHIAWETGPVFVFRGKYREAT
jgi:hypothetical protein